MANYHTDRALISPIDDLFGRASYAENIVKVIVNQPMDEKYVIGLHSPWGYGKTSVLNMMETYLEDKNSVVVRYNPWVYADIKSMTIGLLSEISNKIILDEISGQDKKSKLKRGFKRMQIKGVSGAARSLSENLGSIAEAVSLSPADPVDLTGKGVSSIFSLIGKNSFNTLQKNVENAIKTFNKRIVVVIDDVDRLDKDEIFQLFKLVKAVADFNGITYVIAFDNIAVAKALNGRFSGNKEGHDGKDFLEKIIQIPLNLPFIPSVELRDMFINGLNELLKEYDLDLSDDDQRRFWDVFEDHIMPSLKTPRAVKRYLNLLTFTLPLANNEINTTDAVVLTGLKLLYPATYENIQREKLLLTGTAGYEFLQDDDARKNKTKKRLEELLADGEKKAASILSALFPAIQNAYGGSSSWDDSHERLQEDKRVAFADYFDRYFVFGIGKSDVADTEIISTLGLDDENTITQNLKKLAKDAASQKLIIGKINQYRHLISNERKFLRGLVGAADSLSSSQQFGFFTRDGVDVFADLLFTIVRNSKSDVLELVKDIFAYCGNNDLLTYIIRDINLASEKDKNNPDRQPLLGERTFAQFKELAVKKIAQVAKNTKLYDPPHQVSYILYQYWVDFTDSNAAVEKNLKTKLKTSDDVLDFLTCYLSTWTSGKGRFRGNFDSASYKTVEKLIDPDYLYQILIKNDPELANTAKYIPLEDRFSKTTFNKVGNEKNKDFREILAQEFAFMHKQAIEKESTEPQVQEPV